MQPIHEISLFSPRALAQRQQRALLLQFILAELFSAHRAYLEGQQLEVIFSQHPRLFPYDWGAGCGFLNKMKEHGLLLKKSFPDHAKAVKHFEQLLAPLMWEKKKRFSKKTLKIFYSALEPLLEACKENENLLFFLLKKRDDIDALMQSGYLRDFLNRIHPCGLEMLGEKMCDRYHQRGFFAQITELKLLIIDLIHG